MPTFTFNLIYVPKLTKTLNCQLIFNDIDCVIHDIWSKMMIGKTKVNGGLYLFTSPTTTLNHTPSNYLINAIQPPTNT